MDAPRQMFPRHEQGRIVHRAWEVDLERALAVRQGSRLDARRLLLEAREMETHFPRWLLTLEHRRELGLCASCKGMLVFDRGLRCVACERPAGKLPQGASLCWFGLLPPIGIDGLDRLRPRLVSRPPAMHVVGSREGLGSYMLVPLVASYPPAFPSEDPRISYLPGFFSIPGIPPEGPRHTTHMLEHGRMCLFAPGQWQPALTCRQVLQQRAYAHVIKLLNFANGKAQAFAVVS